MLRSVRLFSVTAPLALVAASFALAACSSAATSDFDDEGNGASTSRAKTKADGGTSTPGFGNEGTGGTSGTPAPCVPNAANFEVPGNGCDDDADGQVDNVLACDEAIAANADADAFVRSLGLCQKSTGAADSKWGVVSAKYVGAFGSTAAPRQEQHGILSKYGNVVKPREGKSLGVLSTGAAREYNSMILQTPFKDGSLKPTARASVVPAGFPKPDAGCPQENDVYDVADLRVELKVPANAKGIGFDFNFYSSEWPDFVCTPFNDSFIAYLSSKAFNGGKPDNISFDAKKNPVSVNNGFFDICSSSSITACGQDLSSTHPGACAQGPNELGGTGFGLSLPFCGKQDLGGGATGWLTSQAPVTPGEVVTIDFMIWNTGDQDLDSVVLLDNFRFEAGETTVSTSRPPPR